MTREQEIKEEIKKYNAMLKEPECDFTAQTWIGVALQDLRRELKQIKIEQKLSQSFKDLYGKKPHN